MEDLGGWAVGGGGWRWRWGGGCGGYGDGGLRVRGKSRGTGRGRGRRRVGCCGQTARLVGSKLLGPCLPCDLIRAYITVTPWSLCGLICMRLWVASRLSVPQRGRAFAVPTLWLLQHSHPRSHAANFTRASFHTSSCFLVVPRCHSDQKEVPDIIRRFMLSCALPPHLMLTTLACWWYQPAGIMTALLIGIRICLARSWSLGPFESHAAPPAPTHPDAPAACSSPTL